MSEDRIGPYTLVRVLGEGAFGTVHLAEDVHGSRCAIKRLRIGTASSDVRAAFERELSIGKRPISPMVARVLDYDLHAPQPWLAMEYAEGRTLADVLQQEGPMDTRRTRRISLQLAQGLQALHAQGLIHRDLKPDNIRIGLNDAVKIVDLGFAKESDSALSRIAGTPLYMPPEAAVGVVGAYTDIYAFGVIVVEMLTGKCPTGGTTAVQDAIPTAWRPFLGGTVAADYRERPSAAQLVAALDGGRSRLPARSEGKGPATQRPQPATAAAARPHLVASLALPERDYRTAVPLAGLAGWMGAHRFYVGKYGTGLAQLLTVGGLGLWWLYDVWHLHSGGFRDSEGRPLKGDPPRWYWSSGVAAVIAVFYLLGDFESSDVFYGVLGAALLLGDLVLSAYLFAQDRRRGGANLVRSAPAGTPDEARILREARIQWSGGDKGPYPTLHRQMIARAELDASRRVGRRALACEGLQVPAALHEVLDTYTAHMIRTFRGEAAREIQYPGTGVRARWEPTPEGLVVELSGTSQLDPSVRLDGLQQLELARLGFRAGATRDQGFQFEVSEPSDIRAAATALVLALADVFHVDEHALLGSVEMLRFVDGLGDDGASVIRA